VDAPARRAGLAPERRPGVLHAMAWHHGPPVGQQAGAASPEPSSRSGSIAPR
jgi:hypothetical protein